MKSELFESARPCAFPEVDLDHFNLQAGCVEAFPGDHFVQFYEDDGFLAETVGEFINAGLSAGDGAIVIATHAHRSAIENKLKAQGTDLLAAKSHGQLVCLDAAETLSKFMVGGLPDADLFESAVGSIVAQVGAGRGGLRAFGEMVAVLWAGGSRSAALRLENLWNRLRERHSFSLLCAYPIREFRGNDNREDFHLVCNTHSHVLPAESYPRAVGTADERLRSVAVLQQKAASLEAEIAERKRTERELRRVQEELEARLAGQAADLIEKAEISAELRRQTNELTNFIETAAVGLHWVGPDGKILWANTAEMALLGYSSEEYIGCNIAEFHADQAVIGDILARLHRGEKLQNYEAELKCKDGSIKTVLIDSSVLWENGQFIHTQCFTRDISDRKRDSQAARLLAAIVESSEDAIVGKNLEGRIQSWNRGAEQLFGYTAEEVIGRCITLLIPSGRLQEEEQILRRIRRGERVDHFETVRQRKDGSFVDISLTVSPIKDSEGRIVGASKVARDISERQRAKEKLEQVVAERTASLRQAVEQMEEFSYTISHDLRAPLRAMKVYSRALLEDFSPQLPAEAQTYLQRINDNSSRLDKMILDVLTVSRLARADVGLATVSLQRVVREILDHYPGMQPPHAEIQVEDLPDVIGHEPSLTQAISNLLSNAVKFVAPGVTPKVRLWTERLDSDVRLWIEDNGIGIQPKYQKRLFTMFERLHPELEYDGTGVGLAIVRKATERMGGSVGIESDGKNGSKFWIQLRAAEEGS